MVHHFCLLKYYFFVTHQLDALYSQSKHMEDFMAVVIVSRKRKDILNTLFFRLPIIKEEQMKGMPHLQKIIKLVCLPYLM